VADAFNFPAVPRSEYRHNILKGVADWMRSRQNTEWAKRYSYVHLLIGWADDLDRIRQELESAHEAGPDLPPLPEPDCWAILTPNGSKLVSPEEAKGALGAYPLYRHPPAAGVDGTDAAIQRSRERAAGSQGDPR
jgi:hypothetical protein